MRKLKRVIIMVILFKTISSFGQVQVISDSTPVGLYYLDLTEGWHREKNGDETVSGLSHYLFIELKKDNTVIFTIINKGIDPNSNYEIGTWNLDGDTIEITFKARVNSPAWKLIWEKNIHDSFDLSDLKTKKAYSKTKREEWTGEELPSIFTGKVRMINGIAMLELNMEFADSTLYYFDGLIKWDNKYMIEKIKICGILVEVNGRRTIKNWQFIE